MSVNAVEAKITYLMMLLQINDRCANTEAAGTNYYLMGYIQPSYSTRCFSAKIVRLLVTHHYPTFDYTIYNGAIYGPFRDCPGIVIFVA